MSIAKHIWWGIVGSVSVGIVAACFIAWFASHSLLMNACDTSLKQHANFLSTVPAPPRHFPEKGHKKNGRHTNNSDKKHHRRHRHLPGLLISMTLPDGSPILTDEEWPAGLPHVITPNNRPHTISTDDGSRYRLLQVPFAQSKETPAHPNRSHLLLAVPIDRLLEDLRLLALILLCTACGTISIAMIIAGRLSKRLIAPIHTLTQAIDTLPPDELDARLNLSNLPTEPAHIAARIDELLKRLSTSRQSERRTIANIAHELRTPLAALRSNIGFAPLEIELKTHVETQLDSLEQRIKSLLLLGTLDANSYHLHKESLLFADALADAWEAHKGTAQLQLTDPENAELQADTNLFAILLNIVLSNAIAHSNDTYIHITVQSTDAAWQISISNSCTHPAGDWNDAFAPFWRHDQARSQTDQHAGLGLTLAASIARVHNGHITAQVNKEQQFIVSLIWPFLSEKP